MGLLDKAGKGAVWLGNKLISKTPTEAAENIGIKFLDNYKPGMKLPKQLRKYMNIQNKPGWLKKILKLTTGAGLLGGVEEIGRAIGKEQMRAKGGYVRKMKAGGSVRRMKAGGAVNSRAIAKKYFKGGMV